MADLQSSLEPMAVASFLLHNEQVMLASIAISLKRIADAIAPTEGGLDFACLVMDINSLVQRPVG